MSTRIDFHSHIIPGADHGCASATEATQQLIMMKNAGIGTVVATPHFYPAQHDVEDFLLRLENGIKLLREVRPADAPRLLLGSEVLLCPGLHKMPGVETLCIRGTRTMLLELPFTGCTQELIDSVEDILSYGYTVVLAHINRYLQNDEDAIDYLLRMGAWAQINASSLRGILGRKRLMPYVESGSVVAFGSDLHGTDKKAIADFAALQKLPPDLLDWIFQKSEALLEGAETIW